MSTQSRKGTELALGSSLKMYVLILMTFVIASAEELLSCNEYCTSIISGQIRSTERSECNCFSQNAETEANKSTNLDGNPIYYEPIEFHPLPDISFVYQTFVISNPTSSLPNQESEDHKKYKRKDNVIHKISIDTSKKPLYLDIDIKNSPHRSRYSQTDKETNELDDLDLTEEALKDCIDLHLLIHYRRNESDKPKQNWNLENLEKYFHISDDDLTKELDKKCKQPSKIVDQSFHQIKERARKINPPHNSSDKDLSDDDQKWNLNIVNDSVGISLLNKPLIPISTEEPLIVPENYSLDNNKDQNIFNVSTSYKNNFDEKPQQGSGENEIFRLNDSILAESSSVIPIELNKSVKAEKNKERTDNSLPKTTNKTVKHVNDTKFIPDKEVFYKPKFEQVPVLSLLNEVDPQKESEDTEMASTVQESEFVAINNKAHNYTKSDGVVATNNDDFLRLEPQTTLNEQESLEKKYFDKDIKIVPATTQNDLIGNTIATYLTNDFSIENASIINNISNSRALETEIDNDQEQSPSNMGYVIFKNADYTPEVTTNNMAIVSETDNFLLSTHEGTDRNLNKYEPSQMYIKKDSKEITNSLSNYSENDVKLFTTSTEKSVSNNITTYANRTSIPQSKLQIPRIFVTEHLNGTFDSIIDGIEEIPNNDFIGLTNFELDVADLTSSKENSVKDNQTSIENSESKETLIKHISENRNSNEAEESIETSNSSEISGNLYFNFKKLLIPMHFTQTPDGDLKLTLDGASFCTNLIKDTSNNGILSILCNSAVHSKNECTKT